MSILEILEAHAPAVETIGSEMDEFGRVLDWHDQIICKCGEWPEDETAHRAHVAQVLEQHEREREAQFRQLVRDMVDPDPCYFDHHGGCQAHGYLSLKPGELCPHAEAKQLLGDEPDGRD